MSHTNESGVSFLIVSIVSVAVLWMLSPGIAWSQAILTADVNGVDFGAQRVDETSDPELVSVYNIGVGTATEIVCSVAMRPPFNSPADVDSFSLSACPVVLSAGETFDIDVWFTPYTTGPIGATLRIDYNSGIEDTFESVDLDGIGADGGDLVVNGDWGDVDIGHQHVSAGPTAPSTQVAMENRHTSMTLTITAINMGGISCTDTFFFGIPSMPIVIPAGATDYFSVSFDPSEHGIETCEVSFVSDDIDPPDTVSVTGTGTNQTIEVTPFGYDFGIVEVGTGPVEHDFFVANNGDLGTLTISMVSLNGVDCGAFALTDIPPIPFDISPGNIETITVEYEPRAQGGHVCSVEILSNDAATPSTYLPLSGTAIGSALIFSDGFDAGTTDLWSVVVP